MAEIKVKLRPWLVPSFVSIKQPARPRQEGLQESPSLPLSEIPAETLADMCDDFRAEVFRKAGKRDPHTCVIAAEGGTE